MSTRPRPFPDLRDPRTDAQREADRAAAVAQASALAQLAQRARGGGAARAAVTSGNGSQDDALSGDPFERLQARRLRDADPGDLAGANDVQFEVVSTAVGGRTPVVLDEVVERRGRRPVGTSHLDGAGFLEDDRLAASCPELASRLVRYRATAPTADDRTRDVAASGTTRVGVALLHVVIKSTPPRPTEVLPPPVPKRPLEVARRVVVAVVDTGISTDVRADGWLADVDRTGATDPPDVFPAPGGNGRLDLGTGHGTFVAGIIRQVDPLAEIRMYRAMDSDGVGSEISVACAMIQAVKDGADVVNLSLGGNTVDGQPSVVYEAALDVIDELTAGQPGRPVIVAAAGNAGDDEPVWPAASIRVVAVGGLTPDGDGATWSSRGPWVDVSTIGQGIVSSYVMGTTEDPDPPVDDDGDGQPDPAPTFPLDSWAMWTGTSFAAAQVSGAIARLSRQGGLTPQAAADQLIAGGEPIEDFGRGVEILPGT